MRWLCADAAPPFAAQAVQLPRGSVYVVDDASAHEAYRANPIIAALGLRHVSATALVTPDDIVIGTLVVMDTAPHGLSPQQQESLRRLARAVVRTLELRSAAAEREQLRASAAAAATAAAAAKDSLVALLSHEVRTPLQAVTGAVSLLAGTALSAAQHDLLRLLDEGAAQLARVITDVIDYDALGDAGDGRRADVAEMYRLDADVLAPALALESLPAAAQSRLRSRRVALRHSVGPRVPGTLLGDATALRRIVTNLVANALKYAPDDGSGVVTLRVERCCDADGSGSDSSSDEEAEGVGPPAPAPNEPHAGGTHLRIRVTDNGCGIAEERIEAVFTPLEAAGDAARHEHGGAGLGLAICRRLAHGMGATLSARSAGLGTGACFTLTLPLALALPPATLATQTAAAAQQPPKPKFSLVRSLDTLLPISDADVAALSLSPAEAPPTAAPDAQTSSKVAPLPPSAQQPLVPVAPPLQPLRRADGAPLRVLLAEDNVLCAAVVLRLLSRAGASVTLVLDGAQAVQQCAAPGADFDLVVMDLEMPVLDGVGAALQIAALGDACGRRRVPTVALSANCSDAVRERCAAAGIKAHLAKPLRTEHLQTLRAHALC